MNQHIMAPYASRLRRSISISSSLFHHYSSITPPINQTIKTHSLNHPSSRFFSSTNTSTSSPPRSLPNYKNNAADDINPGSILFEGCDFNHWLIVVDFPKHPKPSSEQMLNFYQQSAAKIFGSLEEAKKKIYACCTTAYTGFQVECSEETSEKFEDLDGVTFVLPDSYIDPVTKEYGGDKYIDGQIIPRPPANKYGRLGPRRDLKSRPYAGGQTEGESQNYGLPGTCPTRQNFGPPSPQKNHVEASRAQQYYGPPQKIPQQKYGSHLRQIYGPRRGEVNAQGCQRDRMPSNQTQHNQS